MIAVSMSTAQFAPMRDPNSSSLTSSSASSSLKVASSSFKLRCAQIVMGLWQLITWRYSLPCLQGSFWYQSDCRKSIKQRTNENYGTSNAPLIWSHYNFLALNKSCISFRFSTVLIFPSQPLEDLWDSPGGESRGPESKRQQKNTGWLETNISGITTKCNPSNMEALLLIFPFQKKNDL